MTEKDLHWRGSSYRDFLSFPDKASREAGYQLGFVQLGFEPADWKPMRSIGQGVRGRSEFTLRVNSECATSPNKIETVYVLHAFQKKSRKTSKRDVDIAKTRFRELERERKL